METIETLQQEIIDKITEFNEIAEQLKSKQSVSHKNKGSLQWGGGIIGSIQEAREENRLYKMLNEPIIGNKSFYNLCFYIIEGADYMVERQLKIQQQIDKEDKRYYGFVIDIFNCLQIISTAWYNYSLDMADAPITIDKEENVALAPSVKYYSFEPLGKLDAPEQVKAYLKKIKDEDGNIGGGGCFGVLILLIAGAASLIGASCWGISHLLAI